MHEHICIYNSPTVKLHVQIDQCQYLHVVHNFLQRNLVNYLLIMAQALHSTISHVLL